MKKSILDKTEKIKIQLLPNHLHINTKTHTHIALYMYTLYTYMYLLYQLERKTLKMSTGKFILDNLYSVISFCFLYAERYKNVF